MSARQRRLPWSTRRAETHTVVRLRQGLRRTYEVLEHGRALVRIGVAAGHETQRRNRVSVLVAHGRGHAISKRVGQAFRAEKSLLRGTLDIAQEFRHVDSLAVVEHEV